MSAKRIDYDGMISVYHNISKTRPLTDWETDRLCEIMRRKESAENSARYRARNLEQTRASQREAYARDPERRKKQHREYLARHPEVNKRYCAKWRAEHPERVAADSARRKRQRSGEAVPKTENP